MEAIEQAAKDAAYVTPENPMLPAQTVIRANDPLGLKMMGLQLVGGERKVLIE
jgi:hypothetical protein